MKNVLILNDYVAKGKIAGRLMSSVLSYMDVEAFMLPTALIANNFSLGKNAFFKTDSFIKNSLKTWGELDFKFDMIFIGYIEDKAQKDLIVDYLENISYETFIVFDPIMGDDGSLYPGLDNSKIENYKEILSISDLVIPNITEAKFLGLDEEKMLDMDKKFIVTSIRENGKNMVSFFDKKRLDIPYEEIDIKVGGSGDLFDGLFIGYKLKGNSFKDSIKKTNDSISKILRALKEEDPKASEIHIEKFLNLIER